MNPAEVAETAGVELAALEHLAEMFANSNALAIPGGAALGQSTVWKLPKRFWR
ncbi:MAG: hypothetical protein IPJ47_18000 [Anaerolineales bacterium]|nr:hypothetical protein [Anaerolineales bacterium]